MKSHVPSEAFRLLQGADNLSHYRFGEGSIDHTFCRTCGVYAFVSASEPATPVSSGMPEPVAD